MPDDSNVTNIKKAGSPNTSGSPGGKEARSNTEKDAGSASKDTESSNLRDLVAALDEVAKQVRLERLAHNKVLRGHDHAFEVLRDAAVAHTALQKSLEEQSKLTADVIRQSDRHFEASNAHLAVANTLAKSQKEIAATANEHFGVANTLAAGQKQISTTANLVLVVSVVVSVLALAIGVVFQTSAAWQQAASVRQERLHTFEQNWLGNDSLRRVHSFVAARRPIPIVEIPSENGDGVTVEEVIAYGNFLDRVARFALKNNENEALVRPEFADAIVQAYSTREFRSIIGRFEAGELPVWSDGQPYWHNFSEYAKNLCEKNPARCDPA